MGSDVNRHTGETLCPYRNDLSNGARHAAPISDTGSLVLSLSLVRSFYSLCEKNVEKECTDKSYTVEKKIERKRGWGEHDEAKNAPIAC